jgi:translocation and assembly module TamB
LQAGPKLSLNAAGTVPLTATGPLDLHVTGQADLRLADALLAITGVAVRGVASTDLTLTGTPRAPNAAGTLTLAKGAVQDIASGLNLTAINGSLTASGNNLDLTNLTATAGAGQLAAHGTLGLQAPMPVNLTLSAHNATPVTSDIVTETLDGDVTLTGALRGAMALGGQIRIDQANINIPASLPPEVANLPILNELPPTTAAPPPPPPVRLNLLITAGDRIFVRGDGLFAEFGGHLRLGGTAASPQPEGGFDLIRGAFSLAGTALQFTSGTISFNGDGFSPALDVVATATGSDNNSTDTLTVGGTASQPSITLSSTPPLPSDEILAELLFGQSTASLSPFQAASLAAALAQLSGVGGGFNPLDKLRNALGLDELSLSGSGSGPPALQAGRYVAPGVYLGAAQATSGQGTQASVQINLTKGLKLDTTTGTSSTGVGSSVGLTYQFNY